jgi:Holliday junction resolvase RusA-like endonuclease
MQINFTVYGKAEPRGSKKFVGLRGKKGILVDSNVKSGAYMKEIKREAARIMDGANLLNTALRVRFRFFRRRPVGHFKKDGSIKPKFARMYPITKPDVLKLARAAEDAMTGIVYVDDALICDEVLQKRYVAQGGVERLEIMIEELPE